MVLLLLTRKRELLLLVKTPGGADGEESCCCLKLGVDNSKGQQQWSIESEREEGGGSVVT